MDGDQFSGACRLNMNDIHTPVNLERTLELLAPALELPGAVVVDATLGMGGHAFAMLERFPELGVVPRAGIVHRLDKDTSGLMLIARTLSVHARLVRLMAAREVGRRYLVLVHGVPAAPFAVDAPIGRHPRRGGRKCGRSFRLGKGVGL